MCAKRPHVPSLSHACDVRFGQLTRAQSIKDTPLTATGRTRTHLPGARRRGHSDRTGTQCHNSQDPTGVRQPVTRRRRETAIGRSDLRRIKRTPHVSTELSHESAVSCDVGRDTATHEREHTTLLVSPVDRDSRVLAQAHPWRPSTCTSLPTARARPGPIQAQGHPAQPSHGDTSRGREASARARSVAVAGRLL
jgi:hypothetical protein